MANSIQKRAASIAERFLSVTPSPRPPRTVLVVDDEETVRRFVERVLRSAGYATVVAEGGADAMRVANSIDTLDMVVTDVMMPDMSGCELARQLRQSNPDLKVLYVTGYSDRLFEEKVMMWENEAFIEKPCSLKALLEAVSLLWSQHIDTAIGVEPFDYLGHSARLAS